MLVGIQLVGKLATVFVALSAAYAQAPPKSSACSANFVSFSNKLFLVSPVSDWVCSHKPLKSKCIY